MAAVSVQKNLILLLYLFLMITSLVFFSTCKKSKGQISPPADATTPGGGAPTKTSTQSPHRRLYFEFKNCDWNDLRYLGYEDVTTFDQKNPKELAENIREKYVVVEFANEYKKDEVTVLYTTYIPNLGLVDSPKSGYRIFDCHYRFFVDAPNSLHYDQVRAIYFSFLDENGLHTLGKQSFLSNDIDVKLSNPGNLFLENAPLDLKNTPHRVVRIHGNAPPERAWDVVMLVDGATSSELNITSDEGLISSSIGKKLALLVDGILSVAPFNAFKDQVNFWFVATLSKESGTDIPNENISVSTFYESSLGGNCVSRQISIDNSLHALQMASQVPFDQMVMLINSTKHGGSTHGWGATISMTLHSEYIETMVHEIGHALGQLSDQYKYFSDDENQLECRDFQREQFIVRDHPKKDDDKEKSLAPNETSFATLKDAKWKDLLHSHSPIINISYPGEIGIADEKKLSLTFHFKDRPEGDKLIFFSGLDLETNHNLFNFRQLFIGEKLIEKTERKEVEGPPLLFPLDEGSNAYTFVTVNKPFPQEDLTIRLVYGDKKSWEEVQYSIYDANTLTLVSELFDPKEIGLFQGSNTNLSTVWRSSYVSLMGSHDFKFDRVEERAISQALQAYLE